MGVLIATSALRVIIF